MNAMILGLFFAAILLASISKSKAGPAEDAVARVFNAWGYWIAIYDKDYLPNENSPHLREMLAFDQVTAAYMCGSNPVLSSPKALQALNWFRGTPMREPVAARRYFMRLFTLYAERGGYIYVNGTKCGRRFPIYRTKSRHINIYFDGELYYQSKKMEQHTEYFIHQNIDKGNKRVHKLHTGDRYFDGTQYASYAESPKEDYPFAILAQASESDFLMGVPKCVGKRADFIDCFREIDFEYKEMVKTGVLPEKW